MIIVHSEAPWGQPQEERLSQKQRTHPMRPLSRNNNTTTRLKRGPNPLSGVLILFILFIFVFFCIFCIFFFFVFFFTFLFFLLYFFLYFFLFLFLYFYFLVLFYFILFLFNLYISVLIQTIKSPGYREVLILSLGS